jgi:hypothetical protein
MTIKRYQGCIRIQYAQLDLFLFRRWYKQLPKSPRLIVALPFLLVYWR